MEKGCPEFIFRTTLFFGSDTASQARGLSSERVPEAELCLIDASLCGRIDDVKEPIGIHINQTQTLFLWVATQVWLSPVIFTPSRWNKTLLGASHLGPLARPPFFVFPFFLCF